MKAYHGRGRGGGGAALRVAPFVLEIGRSAMEKSESQNPHSKDWRFLYRASFLETNGFKKSKRISDTEDAIVERRRELFHEAGADVEAEREAMDEAMYALRAWKSAIDNRANAA